jgi:hypothetical protein
MNSYNYFKKSTSLHDITSTTFEEYHAATVCLQDLNARQGDIFQDPTNGLRLEIDILQVEQDFSVRQMSSAINDYGTPKGLGKIAFLQTTADAIPIIFRYDSSNIPDPLLEHRRFAGLISAVDELSMENSLPNWDGYEAKPILRSVRDEAVRLIKMLPSDIPLPDVSPEPLGTIAFEWYKAKDNLFIASVSGKGIVEYAGLYGTGNRDYGTTRIENTFPRIVSYHIRRLFED